jgi:hypothetical protein
MAQVVAAVAGTGRGARTVQFAGGVGVWCVAGMEPRSTLNGATLTQLYHGLIVLSRDFEDL